MTTGRLNCSWKDISHCPQWIPVPPDPHLDCFVLFLQTQHEVIFVGSQVLLWSVGPAETSEADQLEVVPLNLPNSVPSKGSLFLSLSEAWQMAELPCPTQPLLWTLFPPETQVQSIFSPIPPSIVCFSTVLRSP